jgi:hypothetical protein
VIANAPGYRRAARRHAASMSAIYSTRTMASRTVALWRAVLAHTRETVIDLQTPLNPVPGAGLE